MALGQQSKAVACANCGRVYDVSNFSGDGASITCWTCGGAVTYTAGTTDNVAYLHDIVGIAAGGDHALAVDRFGVVYAWGSNDRGQLGLGLKNTAAAGKDPVWVDNTDNYNVPRSEERRVGKECGS